MVDSVGSHFGADRLRACLVLVLMVGVMTMCGSSDDSTRGPLFIFLCDMGLWERGYVGYTVGQLFLVLGLWSDGMVCVVFHQVRVTAKVAWL